MNILLTSVGRKALFVQYFQKVFSESGRVLVANSEALAAAMYFGDKSYIVPNAKDELWLSTMLTLCKAESIGAILPLLDFEVEMVAKHEADFAAAGVKAVVSDFKVVERCLDKYALYQFMQENGYPCARTYLTLKDLYQDLSTDQISFPVFVKLRSGYGGRLSQKIYSEAELISYLEKYSDEEFLIQEFMGVTEYSADVYVDLLTKELISVFLRKNITIRSGLSDKAVSEKNETLTNLLEEFVLQLGVVGPINIGLFEKNGIYYISEVNPRFGAGYLLAHGCGENYPEYICNNLLGIPNKRKVGDYPEGVYLFTYENFVLKRTDELIVG